MDQETIFKTICAAIDAFNQELPPDKRAVVSREYRLVGSPDLDSADLVNLLVMIEQRLEEDLGVRISLFEEDNLEQIATVGALVDFLKGKASGGTIDH